MSQAPASAYRQAPLPAGGAFRVHPAPGDLPRPDDELPGRNRYDDPQGLYRVRYVAARLTGALVETMARFRTAPAAEALLTQVEHVDERPAAHEAPEPDPRQGLVDWLAVQRVGRLRLTEQVPLVDVHDPTLLVAVDKHPLVRQALDASPLGTATVPARLDEGVIRISGPVGRPITQAVGRAVREWVPDAGGIAYRSRLDDRELCWAIYDHVRVEVISDPLSPDVADHVAAVRATAALLQIALPPPWG